MSSNPVSSNPVSSEPMAASLVINLLGPMQVVVGGHPLNPFRSRKTLWLLALLALRGGRPVQRDWLAATLWPDSDQDQSLSSLRSILSELRKAMADEAECLRSPNRHSLVFDLDGVVVDVLDFDAALASGTPSALQRAVALYRGPLLEGCNEEWVEQERAAREQDCLRALLVLAEAALAEKDWAEAAGYARRAVALDPWRDMARRSLMTSLAGGGDINAALLVYREFVALLRDDPRAAPDPETSALYAQMRARVRQAGRKPAVGAAMESPASAEPTVSGYLPHPLTELVGREGEQEEISALLRRSRLVTQTGPGGIGKTRLAIAVAKEVAGEYPGGVWLVPLEALPAGGQIAPQIASVLGVKEKPGQSPLEAVASHLREKRLLLVLDNCEHLLETTAQTAGHLLQECAGLRVLATSREPLTITGETVWPVPGLAVPDSAHLPVGGATLVRVLGGYEGVQLFVERAQAVQKTFALTAETAPAVAQICARLGGIPLALELAAARVRALTVVDMVARLDDHLSLLTNGSRVAPSRQRTLRATLDWSYALLSVPEQLLLARVSVFAGGWTLEAAEVVCSGEGIETRQMLDLLTSLVDKSLVAFEELRAAGEQARGRYRMLETVRQYSAERLPASGNGKEWVRARHRNWLMSLAEEASPKLRGPEAPKWLRHLENEYDNLRTTLAWEGAIMSDADADLRLVNAIWLFWESRGLYAEGRSSVERAVARAGAFGTELQMARALNVAGCLCYRQGDYAAAWTMHQESLNLNRALGTKKGIVTSLNNLSNVAQEQGDYTKSSVLLEESLSICRELGHMSGTTFALSALGSVYFFRGNYTTARSFYEEGLLICRNLENREGIAIALGNLGLVASCQGDWAAAGALFEESLRLFREVGHRHGIGQSLSSLGRVAQEQGQHSAAQALFEEAHALFTEISDRWGIGLSLHNLGRADFQRAGYAGALALYREALSVRRDIGDREGIATTLEKLAAVTLALAAPEKAARLLGAAQALRESLGAPLPPPEQRVWDQQAEHTRTTLGDNLYAATLTEGRAMTWEQAANYALER